jgi:hypothetical protein
MDNTNSIKNEQDEKHREPDAVELFKKIQQQLIFLEKKIDTLIKQSSPRSFEAKRFSKPLRTFGHSGYHDRGKQGSATGERSFSRGSRFDKPQADGNQRFDREKKPFFRHRKERI